MSKTNISRKTIFEGLFTIGGRIISIFVVIASTKFLTSFLSESEYGNLSLYNVTATLPSLLFFAPLGQGIIRYFSIAKTKGDVLSLMEQSNAIFLKGVWAVCFAGLACSILCYNLISSSWAIAIVLIIISCIFSAYNSYYYGIQNMNRNRFLSLGLETSERVIQQLLSILLLLYVCKDPLIVLGSYAFISFVFYFVNNYYYKVHFQDIEQNNYAETTNYEKEIIKYTWPFTILGLFYWIQNASERWILALFENTETVGKFSVINQIGFQSFTLFMGAVGYFFTPILFNRAGSLDDNTKFKSADDINNKQLNMVIVITIVSVLVTYIFSKEILLLLSDEKYVDVAPMLPLMTLAGGLFNYAQTYTNKFLLSLKSNYILLPRVISSLIGVVLNIISIYFFGLQGLLVSMVLIQVFYIYLLQKRWMAL